VRWPARPAELRAGLDLFVSFSIKGKRKRRNYILRQTLLQLSGHHSYISNDTEIKIQQLLLTPSTQKSS